jgi:arylsulfatase A-like enzyme
MPVEKPNILLVVIDCLRADRTFDEGQSAQTPTLHALAAQGTLFTHLITANSMTIPCMTTMFTGMYPRSHGVRAMVGARVGDEVPLLAELLRAGGYHTYAEATGPLSTYYRLDRGFDHYAYRDGVKADLINQWGDELVARFGRGDFQEPWFAYLHIWGVHRPRQISPEFNDPKFGQTEYDRAVSSYDAALGRLVKKLNLDNTIVIVTGDHGEKIPEGGVENQVESFKKLLSGAGGSQTSNSAWTKRRRKAIATAREAWFSGTRALHRAGLLSSPLVTITGHGYHVYDSLVRVPFLVAGAVPGSHGQRVSDQVRQVDIMPTILDLAGLAAATPPTVNGRSLLPLFEGDALAPIPAYIETCQNTHEASTLYGVRHAGWKYAADVADSSVPVELYDLSADPGEIKNLASANPAKVAEMRDLLDRYLNQEQTEGVSLTDDLSDLELAGLTSHLKKLGYVE